MRYGPTGNYVRPQHNESRRQREIESLRGAYAAGSNLELTSDHGRSHRRLAAADTVSITSRYYDIFQTCPVNATVRRRNAVAGRRACPTAPIGIWRTFASGWISVYLSFRAVRNRRSRQGEKAWRVSPLVSGRLRRTVRSRFFLQRRSNSASTTGPAHPNLRHDMGIVGRRCLRGLFCLKSSRVVLQRRRPRAIRVMMDDVIVGLDAPLTRVLVKCARTITTAARLSDSSSSCAACD